MLWVLLGILGSILLAFIVKYSQKANLNQEFPYRRIDPLFTPTERSFLGVLQKAAGDQVNIFGKVRVADVINPQKGLSRSEWQKAFNRIANKHFDFLICRSDDLSALCVIELNDSSHKSQKRSQRDEFLSAACSEANLPFIQIPAKAAYQIEKVSNIIAPYIKPDNQASILDIESNIPDADKKLCSKCQSEMVLRIAGKGQHAGKKFWGCSAFPKCRYIEPA